MKNALTFMTDRHAERFQRFIRSTAGYGLAVATTALAALARWLLPGVLSPAPFLGFYPAVVVSAALGGVGPGLVATFAALLLVNFVFGRFNIEDHGAMARQVVWVTASLGVSVLAGMQRAARIRERLQAEELRRWNDELELRVEQRTAEIREANLRLREANEKLAELDHAKTAFFSNVSHEFRTPLTLMLGPLEDALAKRDSLSPADRESLSVVHRNALRVLRLVNTLLDFSRIEAGRIQAGYEPTDLAVLTADLAGVFRSAVERAGLTLSVDCSPLSEPVYVDRDMWEKIVLNLLSNAFKFTLQGGIAVCLAQTDGMVELKVTDTGIGIETSELPYLFERFHRVRGAKGRTFEGTGIGLALVQDLARLHGGGVSVESTHGQGSTFTVRLPLGTAHLPADRIGTARTMTSAPMGAAPFLEEAQHWLPDNERSAHEMTGLYGSAPTAPCRSGLRRQAGAEAGPRPCVLLADDNADMRDYIRRLLEGVYDVHAVADGDAALAAALADPPDLVLSDVMMPGLDGFELLQALRREPKTATVPVILLSARSGEEARVEGMEAGADDYLTKPFSARELLARVKAHIEMARVRREAEAALKEVNERLEERVAVRTAELRESEERLRMLGDNLPESAVYQYVHEPEGGVRFLYFSAGIERLNGVSLEDVLRDAGTLQRQIPPEYFERLVEAEVHSAREMSDFNMEVPMQRPDGEVRWMRLHSRPRRLSDGRIVWDGVQTDITDIKIAEQALHKAHDELAKQMEERTRELREKEVLLKEIHHRVKNNLQVISSLVDLQAGESKEEAVREVLRDVTFRVRSMALVHEKLYQSADLARVDFAQYARSLLDYLWRAHGAVSASIRLTLDLKSVSLPVDTAIPCGLILNELAVNAIKHAFTGRAEGEVTVLLQGDSDGRISFSVRDNGVGLPEGLDWRQARSLGLRLVQMLAGQLHASVEVSTDGGTEFTIAFKGRNA